MLRILSGLCLFAMLVLAACASEESDANYDGYVLRGQTANYEPGTPVRLQKVVGKRAIPLDTASVKADGSFVMKGKLEDKGFAQIVVGHNQAFVIMDNYPVNISIDKNNARKYELSGNSEINTLQALTEKMSNGVLQQNKPYVKEFCDTVSSPFLAYVGMQYLNVEADIDVYEKVNARFQKELPDSELGKELNQFIVQSKQQAASAGKTKIGAVAPNIDLPNPEGANMALADLKGKVVLVDFWASWCGPCRRENPNVVRLYDKYKAQGFEVYSVSLDSDTGRWVQAIEKDNLKWSNHVSDLKKWSSAPAALYGVKSIPTTFLLDKDGKIIGKNLRGAQLESKLAEIFG